MMMEQLEVIAKEAAEGLEKKMGEGAHVIVMVLDGKTGSHYAAWKGGSGFGLVYSVELLSHLLKQSFFEKPKPQ